MFSMENDACKYIKQEFLSQHVRTVDGYYATRIVIDDSKNLDAMSDEDFLTFLFLLLMVG